MTAMVDYATEHLLSAKMEGYCPHACVWVPLGVMGMPETFMNPNEFGDIKLKLTGESGAGAIRVTTVQLRV